MLVPHVSVPQQVLYAALAGCFVSLLVATAQQNWKPRVFFLLALRIAIGWQFLFEGMNKIQSHSVGVTATSKPFSSEPYFRESEGPAGELMRARMIADPERQMYDLVRPATNPATVGDVLGDEGAAALRVDLAKMGVVLNVARSYVPRPATDEINETAKAILALPLNGMGSRFLGDYPSTAAGRAAVEERVAEQLPSEAARQFTGMAEKVVRSPLTDDPKKLEGVQNELKAFRYTYARWALGLDKQPAKKKYVSGDVVQGVPTRLADYEARKRELAELDARRDIDLGRSTLFARIASTKADMAGVRADLVKDAEAQLDTARTELAKLAGVPKPEAEPAPTRSALSNIKVTDAITMWLLTLAGAGLVLGLGTRISALVCGVFLVMTYLTYMPVPWYPNPPGTEGNPVFVNKNIIECIACFAFVFMPTGQWLGIDALIYKLYKGRNTPVSE